MKKIFATAINCMDGRVQLPVIHWLQKEALVDYVDMITEPGPNKILSENKDRAIIESIKTRVEISTKMRNSKLIAIVGHFDCAGNPTPKDIQLKEIRSAIEIVKDWNFDAKIIGLWVDENFKVSSIK
ncbi:MAG: hypothetical protein KR126chlam4_00086 [Candidatus Anoxychlamydiales bacterium]|nr:hypothetical protein [Candidatus Anoxychlamydiales bacterium]NGX40269.1 hypothetical protein [Candidatus Anoxychlamydiales bacterium]HEU64798.1 hypothetical protein [Chlamydiota bacterium]